MRNILAKQERLRARGKATLRVSKGHPLFLYNGNSFTILAMGSPGVKCRITLQIRDKPVQVSIDDVF